MSLRTIPRLGALLIGASACDGGDAPPSVPRCGNGVLEVGEECDGGEAPPAGCSPDCRLTGPGGLCAGVVPQPENEPTLKLLTDRVQAPIAALSPPLDVHRLFIVEHRGAIRIFKDGELLDAPFLDITDRVRYLNEFGLLDMVFHPDYAANGIFFVNYIDLEGSSRLSRFSRGADPDLADPDSERVILTIPQPDDIHNGGRMAFGPDGRLYVAMGDGGPQNDPRDRAQNDADLLGKILRLDVEGAAAEAPPYGAVPPDNPHAEAGWPLGLVWAKGLRSPWGISFDPVGGDLYVVDVGFNTWEEINHVPAGSGAGANFGWDIFEGEACYEPQPHFEECPTDTSPFVNPVLVYGHSETVVHGCSVTGGHVYRGCAFPEWQGRYFYSDWCASFVRSFRIQGDRATDDRAHDQAVYRDWSDGDWPSSIVGIGQDARGELYWLDMTSNRVFRLSRKE